MSSIQQLGYGIACLTLVVIVWGLVLNYGHLIKRGDD
jgi:hypothetical protein